MTSQNRPSYPTIFSRPKHHGVSFATPLHTEPEGPTDPAQVKLPEPYVVAVLGGSRGIGAGIALAYAKAGATGFLLGARKETSLHDTAKAILAVRPNAKIVCQSVDVTKADEVKAAADATETAFGRLDVCVVNAGITGSLIKDPATGKLRFPNGVAEPDSYEFLQVLSTNFTGVYLSAKHFVPLLENTKDGAQAFISINSNAVHMTSSAFLPMSYSLSKFAAARVVEMVHEAHSPQGVLAYSVHPGGVKTDIASELPDGFDPAGKSMQGKWTSLDWTRFC